MERKGDLISNIRYKKEIEIVTFQDCDLVFFQLPGEVLHLRKPLFQHGEGFLFLLSGVQRGNAGENRFNGPRLFGEVDRLFEQTMERAKLKSELDDMRRLVDRIPPEILAELKRQQRQHGKER